MTKDDTLPIMFERVEEMRFSQTQEREVSRLIEVCFPVEFEGRSFFQNRHHCRLVLWHGDRLVGHAALAYRAIRLGKELVDIIGLAEVAVDPDYQRSGLGRRLVLEALEEGRKCGAQFALLFGTSPLYEATGFSAAPDNQIRIVNMRGAQTANVQNLSYHHLMVQALGTHSWDYTADIDLAGFPF